MIPDLKLVNTYRHVHQLCIRRKILNPLWIKWRKRVKRKMNEHMLNILATWKTDVCSLQSILQEGAEKFSVRLRRIQKKKKYKSNKIWYLDRVWEVCCNQNFPASIRTITHSCVCISVLIKSCAKWTVYSVVRFLICEPDLTKKSFMSKKKKKTWS